MVRVLIVDDDADVRLTLPSALAAVAPELDLCAVSGVGAAWVKIISWVPDVVLLDACMPLVDGDAPSSGPSAGLRFLVESRHRTPYLRVIMYTGSDAWRSACMRQGAQAYIVKPVAPADLAHVILRAASPGAAR